MKVLLVAAAGRIGRAAAALLARHPEVASLTLATHRTEAPPAHGASEAARVRWVRLDVEADAPELFSGHDVVLSCAGPAFATEEAAVDAAMAAGTPYLSLCDDSVTFAAIRTRDASARGAGVPVVPGCGLSPGLTGVLFAHAAAALDEVTNACLAVAGAIGDGIGGAALAQLQELTFEAPAPVYFPEPVGWVETFLVPHPESETLPGVVEARRGLTEKGAMDVVRAAAAARGRWHDAVRRLAPAARVLPPRGPAWSAARVDVHGFHAGSPTTVTLGVVDHLANLAAGTAVRAALAAGRGDFPAGVHALHEVVDRRALLIELVAAGVRIARLEPEPI